MDIDHVIKEPQLATPNDAIGAIGRLGRADASEVARIWNEAISRGESTHSPEPLSADQVTKYLFEVPARFEVYAYKAREGIVGWAALMRYHERQAYGDTAELAAYVLSSERRHGVGRALVRHALLRASELHFHAVILILQSNPLYLTAAALRMGFRSTGHLSQVLPAGGSWQDIHIFQKLLPG